MDKFHYLDEHPETFLKPIACEVALASSGQFAIELLFNYTPLVPIHAIELKADLVLSVLSSLLSLLLCYFPTSFNHYLYAASTQQGHTPPSPNGLSLKVADPKSYVMVCMHPSTVFVNLNRTAVDIFAMEPQCALNTLRIDPTRDPHEQFLYYPPEIVNQSLQGHGMVSLCCDHDKVLAYAVGMCLHHMLSQKTVAQLVTESKMHKVNAGTYAAFYTQLLAEAKGSKEMNSPLFGLKCFAVRALNFQPEERPSLEKFQQIVHRFLHPTQAQVNPSDFLYYLPIPC